MRTIFMGTIVGLFIGSLSVAGEVQWKHFSSKNGDLEVPNTGKQQTASAVFDIDKDGINDFMIAERTEAPAIVWYKKVKDGWKRHIVEAGPLRVEAGDAHFDIDGDGDLDAVFGGDSGSNEIWWFENPYPDFDQPWKRHTIKSGGANKHHDQMFGDFDGDGKTELVFWNQGAQTLFMAEIPEDPRSAKSWDYVAIYTWSSDSEMQQRGTYPGWKGINEHEGFAKMDIDGDGIEDIIGGGLWFKYQKGDRFIANTIDASYRFTRTAVGDFIKGGRPEVVLMVGDGVAPIMMYEWKKVKPNGGTWIPKVIFDEVDCAHSVNVVDFNQDGNLDLWFAEMRLGGGNPDSLNMVLLGDGKGNFTKQMISQGIANHESKMADLDGDGDYDVLGKPYGWDVPRLDIWIQE
jgi:hypothetical protein